MNGSKYCSLNGLLKFVKLNRLYTNTAKFKLHSSLKFASFTEDLKEDYT